MDALPQLVTALVDYLQCLHSVLYVFVIYCEFTLHYIGLWSGHVSPYGSAVKLRRRSFVAFSLSAPATAALYVWCKRPPPTVIPHHLSQPLERRGRCSSSPSLLHTNDGMHVAIAGDRINHALDGDAPSCLECVAKSFNSWDGSDSAHIFDGTSVFHRSFD